MSPKVNVGLSRKVGEPNFGSRGASCHVEIELDMATLSQDPARFQQRVREAFAACRLAVESELERTPVSNAVARQPDGLAGGCSSSGRRDAGSDNGPRPATANQVKAIQAIAQRASVDLPRELSQRYGVQAPQALDLRQASQFIDVLKELLEAQPASG